MMYGSFQFGAAIGHPLTIRRGVPAGATPFFLAIRPSGPITKLVDFCGKSNRIVIELNLVDQQAVHPEMGAGSAVRSLLKR